MAPFLEGSKNSSAAWYGSMGQWVNSETLDNLEKYLFFQITEDFRLKLTEIDITQSWILQNKIHFLDFKKKKKIGRF